MDVQLSAVTGTLTGAYRLAFDKSIVIEITFICSDEEARTWRTTASRLRY